MYSNWGKRLFDILIAVAIAPPALVLCVLCVVAIRWSDGQFAIFRQIRVGHHCRPFVLYKLRTMSVDTGDRASHESTLAQITQIGRILRKSKLDELPQLINVLKGDMSLVGPRPCLPNQTELIEERSKRGIYDIRPGITGPAQLAGIDMSTPKELAQADALYLKQISLRDDVRYLIRTALGRGSGDAIKQT